MIIPETKKDIVNETRKKIRGRGPVQQGRSSPEGERKKQVIDLWTAATDRIAKEVVSPSWTRTDGKTEVNPVYIMMDSGARGNRQQSPAALRYPRTLWPSLPVKSSSARFFSSFREGLTVLEYFISTHRVARKGLADTALKTADAGYSHPQAVRCRHGRHHRGGRLHHARCVWKKAIYEGDERNRVPA